MTVHELLHQTEFDLVWIQVERYYPDDAGYREQYRQVYRRLGEIIPQPPTPNDWTYGMTLVIKPDRDGMNVFGRREDAPGGKYGLYTTTWNHWLALPLHPKAVERFSPHELLAHCMYLMTVKGYREDDGERFQQAMEQPLSDLRNAENEQ